MIITKMKRVTCRIIWFCICSYVWYPSNKLSFNIKILKKCNKTVQPEYKLSHQHVVCIYIHPNPYPSASLSSTSTPTPTDLYVRNIWDGVRHTTKMIPHHTQGHIIRWIPLQCSRPCCQPIPESTELCYRHIVCSKIADIIATRLQLLRRGFPLQYSESLSAQEALSFSQSWN